MITPFTTPSELAELLGTTLPKLNYVLYVIGTENLYEKFQVPKKNGEVREIRSPDWRLKNLQWRLKGELEELYKPHPAATAFVEGRGIVYNAQKHVKKKVVLNIDLEDFFPSINFGRIYGLLKSKPYSLQENTARLIAHICCFDKILPQGAPTSPVISNMICRKLDRELSLLAKNNKFSYSRYADDITFSSHKGKDSEVCEAENGSLPSEKTVEIIERNGFNINKSKVRLQTNKERQVVTGLKVNNKVNIDRRYIRTTKAMIHSLSLDPFEANRIHRDREGDEAPILEDVVYGRVNFIGMVKGIDSEVYQRLALKFNNLEFNKKLKTNPEKSSSSLEDKLHFYMPSQRKLLERTIWVVSFEGIEGIGLDEQLVQGTAFMCEGHRLFSAYHTFQKAGEVSECKVYRIHEKSKKFRASINRVSQESDLVELEIDNDENEVFEYLKLAPELTPRSGYKLSLVGFPQLREGHQSISITPCTVVNSFVKSTFNFGEIDSQIYAGQSGGPLINAYMQVVGVALLGPTVTFDGSEAFIEGTNAYISAQHLDF